MQVGYRYVDIDNHYYEPDDCFTRHLDSKVADRAVHIERWADDLGRVFIGERWLGYQSVTQIDYIGPPGSPRAYFSDEEDKAIGDDADGGRFGTVVEVVRPRDIAPYTSSTSYGSSRRTPGNASCGTTARRFWESPARSPFSHKS